MRRLISLSFCLFALAISGCSTPIHQKVGSLELGMEKDHVIDLLGSPNRTRRWKGKDEWTYIYYKNDKRQGKDVYFEYGQVVHIKNTQFTPPHKLKLKDSLSFDEYKQKVKKTKDENQKFKNIE